MVENYYTPYLKQFGEWVTDWKNFTVSTVPKPGQIIWLHDSDGATSHVVEDAFIDDKGVTQVYVGRWLPRPELRDKYPVYFTMYIHTGELHKHNIEDLERVYHAGWCASFERPIDHIRFTRSPTVEECKTQIHKLCCTECGAVI